MDFLYPISSSRFPLNSYGVSVFSSRSSIQFRNRRSQFRNQAPSSKIYGYPSSSSSPYFNLPRCRRNLIVFANFSRPTRRSNSLRKKLTQEQQVHRIPIPDNSNSDFQFPERITDHGEVSGHAGGDVSDSIVETKAKRLGESVLWNRLENWVDQYKKDIEFWGIGSGPIFTVFQDSNGNVKWVSINEDEILSRSQVERVDSDDPSGLNNKISAAKMIAREMESGKNVLPRNSSVAKFVIQGDGESSFLKAAQGLSLNFRPQVFTKFSRAGGIVLCSFLLLFSLKKMFAFKKEDVEYTELEKEMMRRKIKFRKEKEVMENGRVEIIQVREEPPNVSFETPRLDKQELMRTIAKEKSKASATKLLLGESTGTMNANVADLSNKIQEIREMARDAREIEAREDALSFSDVNNLSSVNGKLPNHISEHTDEGACSSSDVLRPEKHVFQNVESGLLNSVAPVETSDLHVSSSLSVGVPHNGNGTALNVKDCKISFGIMDATQSDTNRDTQELKADSEQKKPKIIRTVKEAREYLSEKRRKQKPDEKIPCRTGLAAAPGLPNDNGLENVTNKEAYSKDVLLKSSFPFRPPDSSSFISDNFHSARSDKSSISVKDGHSKSSVEEHLVGGSQKLHKSLNREGNGSVTETLPHGETKSWIEENFDEVEAVVKKIGVGFRDNFMVAREKGDQNFDADSTLAQLQYENDNDEELEWMKDDNLKEIVFKVRENELANRDPFYSMNPEDKLTFFNGLEKKVERENEKLLKLHEWLHSNIENLDYGADGISLYDPPEKIIPRWKGHPFEKSPDFFDDFLEQRKAIFNGKVGMPHKEEQNSPLKSTESNPNDSIEEIDDAKMTNHDQELKDSMTIIEGSDGSIRRGKKSGKEFWQHTKKWSQGFLESYNAETDPEVKSVMKDIGKDLDRWITEKDVQEAADLMDKLPERNKKFMEKKLNKLKREMEMFGPQAVVTKYSEYAEEKEEDYLWWLDLRHVLCIELYTVQDGEQGIGFYSLEMAADLELEPKPCHVIAFEDAGDCKNFCYILQSHMEMLGTGNAFIVARPPKDAFREAKANGFGVTVIRKGELQLNVDQTLEEVEEQITEIGSKIYHDKIMKERSVDISSLMKGVFGLSKTPTRRERSKRKRKLKKLKKK